MKFLIICIFDSNCLEIANITIPPLVEYCNLHGYDYLILDKNPDPSREISWGRTFLVKEHLNKYDWVWCVDADLMIMNHTIKLEHVISDKYDVIVTANEGKIDRINTGSILWKNSDFSFNLIDLMYKDGEFARKGYWEQSTIIKLIQNNPNFLHNIKVVHPRLINSFHHFFFVEEGSNYKHGDFVVHLAGSGNNYRTNELKKFKELIIKPLKSIDIPIISIEYH